jgi:hypothetical protein
MSRATPLQSDNRAIRIYPTDWRTVIERLGITDVDAQRRRLRDRLLRGLRLLAAPIPSKRQQTAFIRKIRAARQADQTLLSRASTFDLGLLLECGYPPGFLNKEYRSRAMAACIKADRRLSKLTGKRRDSTHRGWLEGVREISHTLHDDYRGREDRRGSAVQNCILELVLNSGAIGGEEDEKTHDTFREQLPRLLQESGGFGHGHRARARAVESIGNRAKRRPDKEVAYKDKMIGYPQREPAWWNSITEASAETIKAAHAIIEEHERKHEHAVGRKI